MPDFACAVEVIEMYKKQHLPILPAETPDDAFEKRSFERWAADDLIGYLHTNWFYDTPVELIADYIQDTKYRARKYRDLKTGLLYKTAAETAEEIILYFV